MTTPNSVQSTVSQMTQIPERPFAWMHAGKLRVRWPDGQQRSYEMDGTCSAEFIAAGVNAAILSHRTIPSSEPPPQKPAEPSPQAGLVEEVRAWREWHDRGAWRDSHQDLTPGSLYDDVIKARQITDREVRSPRCPSPNPQPKGPELNPHPKCPSCGSLEYANRICMNCVASLRDRPYPASTRGPEPAGGDWRRGAIVTESTARKWYVRYGSDNYLHRSLTWVRCGNRIAPNCDWMNEQTAREALAACKEPPADYPQTDNPPDWAAQQARAIVSMHSNPSQYDHSTLEATIATALREARGTEKVDRLTKELADANLAMTTLEGECVAVIESIPCSVRVREGGGPENIAASLAVSVTNLQRELSALRREKEADRERIRELEKVVLPLLHIIQDDLTHARQKDHAQAIDAAKAAIVGAQ